MKGTKIIIAVAAVVMTATAVNKAIDHWMWQYTPTADFVQAKRVVALNEGATEDFVRLYRYDMDSRIWDRVMDCDVFGEGFYPWYVYTARIGDKEEVLGITVATECAPNYGWKFNVLGKEVTDYDISYYIQESNYRPVYVSTIKVRPEYDRWIYESIDSFAEKQPL